MDWIQIWPGSLLRGVRIPLKCIEESGMKMLQPYKVMSNYVSSSKLIMFDLDWQNCCFSKTIIFFVNCFWLASPFKFNFILCATIKTFWNEKKCIKRLWPLITHLWNRRRKERIMNKVNVFSFNFDTIDKIVLSGEVKLEKGPFKEYFCIWS